MKRVMMFLLSIPVASFLCVDGHAEGNPRVNCDSAGVSLQRKLDNAPIGSTIWVTGACEKGPYVISHDLTIRGLGTSPTLSAPSGVAVLEISGATVTVADLAIDAAGMMVGILINSGSSATLGNVSVEHAEGRGVQVSGNSYAGIFFSRVTANGTGVQIFGSSNASLHGNTIRENIGAGVDLGLGGTADVQEGNLIQANGFGIVLNANSSIYLRGSTISGNVNHGVLVVRGSSLAANEAANTIEENGGSDVVCYSRGILEFGTSAISTTKTMDLSSDCLLEGTIF